MDRDCEHCVNHTSKGCSKWECEFEDIRKYKNFCDIPSDYINRKAAVIKARTEVRTEAIIEDLELMQGWIPTKDRLPKNQRYVLVTIEVPGRTPHVRSSFFYNGYFCNDNGETWKADEKEVVAWMYTPEPYTEGE